MLFYPRVANVPKSLILSLRVSSGGALQGQIEVRQGSEIGTVLGKATIPKTGSWNRYVDVKIPLVLVSSKVDLALCFRGAGGELARMDFWQMQTASVFSSDAR